MISAQLTLAAYGDPLLPQRFWIKVFPCPITGCWLWGAASRGLYGVFRVTTNNLQYAHRVSYQVFVGPIPTGLEIDHLCRQPACVKPSHLEPVTGRINKLRGQTVTAANAAKTHCPAGHSFSGENLVIGTKGQRGCRTCQNARKRADYHATKLPGPGKGVRHRIKTHCPQGHLYSAENTASHHGGRRCKTCHAEQERARNAKTRRKTYDTPGPGSYSWGQKRR